MWDLIYNFCLKHFSFQEELSEIRLNMYIGLHAKYMSFLSDFNEILIFSIVLKKCPNIKFHENPSSGSRVAPRGKNGHKEHDEANSRFSQFCEGT